MNNQHIHVKKEKKELEKEIKTVYYLVYVKRERNAIFSLLLESEIRLHSISSRRFISIAKLFGAIGAVLFLKRIQVLNLWLSLYLKNTSIFQVNIKKCYDTVLAHFFQNIAIFFSSSSNYN